MGTAMGHCVWMTVLGTQRPCFRLLAGVGRHIKYEVNFLCRNANSRAKIGGGQYVAVAHNMSSILSIFCFSLPTPTFPSLLHFKFTALMRRFSQQIKREKNLKFQKRLLNFKTHSRDGDSWKQTLTLKSLVVGYQKTKSWSTRGIIFFSTNNRFRQLQDDLKKTFFTSRKKRDVAELRKL